MRKAIAAVFASAAALMGAAALAQPAPPPPPLQGGGYAAFDVRGTDSWADRLVLCDTTAFLAGHPDLMADRMWVRRDDGRSDLLLPPDFVGGGQWYKEGYERLYFRLQHEHKISYRELIDAQTTVGRRFVEAYRRMGPGYRDERFLRAQDAYCRSMARAQGEIVI